MYNSVDVFISTLLPVSFILALDLLVLCFRPSRQQNDPLLQIVFHRLDEDTEKVNSTSSIFIQLEIHSEENDNNSEIHAGHAARRELIHSRWYPSSYQAVYRRERCVHFVSSLQRILFSKGWLLLFFGDF